MTTLYEIRDRIVDLYRRFDYILRPLAKFAMAFVLLREINVSLGWMERLNNTLLTVIIALVCTLMPMSMVAAVLALVILLHLYALSMEAAAVGAAIFLIVFLVFFRFAPHNAVILLLMPLACKMDLHYAIPLAAGLLFNVGAAVPVALGVVIKEYLQVVADNSARLRGSESVEQLLKNIRFLCDKMVHNRAMWVVAGTMAATVVVVYFIRKLAVAHAWTIASAAGILTEILIFIYAEKHFDVPAALGDHLVWMLVSLLIALIITFFVFNVDFARIENIQFADDDYYYYVKAVPRVSASAPDRNATDFYSEAAERDLFDYGIDEVTEEEKELAGTPTVFRDSSAEGQSAPEAAAGEDAAEEDAASFGAAAGAGIFDRIGNRFRAMMDAYKQKGAEKAAEAEASAEEAAETAGETVTAEETITAEADIEDAPGEAAEETVTADAEPAAEDDTGFVVEDAEETAQAIEAEESLGKKAGDEV